MPEFWEEQSAQRKELMSEDSGQVMPSDLPRAYASVRATTERLAAPLSAEDQTVQTMPDVSPTKWHRAHVTWFFETFILGEYATGYRAFNDAYARLTGTCNACHQATERGFVVIRVPRSSPFPDQDFLPVRP